MAEHIALRFDWEEISHNRVTEFLGLNGRSMNDGSASWQAVAICTNGNTILLEVEPDSDEVIVSLGAKPCGKGWERIPSFDFAIGEPLGWCWVGRNYRGYKDSFIIAFGDVVPNALDPRCMFIAAASSLSCLDLTYRLA